MHKEETGSSDDPLWYKDAVIYQLHVRSFFDHNNDGVGDFRGLAEKLDYIQRLGVNAIWLLPFYPSPMRDDGYDIASYLAINPVYGTLRNFKTFVREAHKRGLKIITELVINHTSDQHPWFQAARSAPRGSAKRDFYIWSDSNKDFPETRIIFTDTEDSNWAWDPVAKQFYWHRFFSHQPDLNHNNPEVVAAVIRVMKFWLDLGVDGLRLDAIPYLCVRKGTNNENLPETHAVIRQIRSAVDRDYSGRMLLAEANQWPEDVREYFADGDECHMAYHFPLMPRMYMAIAQEDRYPIVEIMQQTPSIPDNCQWAIFLRNHDELTLEMVTDRERDYMYSTYASDPRMRVNVGIRRRLAPLMENDRRKIELMKSLLFSMPGSPTVYYGDELGMGDNIYLGDRNSVRTPMQWSPDRNGGFSRSDPQGLFLPPIMDPIYGYESVNVEAQSREPASLLNWTRRILSVRNSHKAFGRGTLEFLHPGNRKVLAYLRRYRDDVLLCVANLKRSPQAVELDLSAYKGFVPVELIGGATFPPIGDLPYLLTLDGHGFFWFELTTGTEAPSWHAELLAAEPPPWLVLFDGLGSFVEAPSGVPSAQAERLLGQFEGDALPRFLSQQRWFAAKGQKIEAATLRDRCEWRTGRGRWLLTTIDTRPSNSDAQEYFLPMALDWGADRAGPIAAAAVARVRQRADTGVLFDAFAVEAFARDLLERMAGGETVQCGNASLHFESTASLHERLSGDIDELPVRHPPTEGSNSTFVIGDSLFLKAYRQLRPGINPEWEMGRFLTEASPCVAVVPVAGMIEYRAADGSRSTLALLQAAIKNQGDGWNYTLQYLERFADDVLTRSSGSEPGEWNHHDYLLSMRTLAARTADLHRALAVRTGDPAFDPVVLDQSGFEAWVHRLRYEGSKTFELVVNSLETLGSALAADGLEGPGTAQVQEYAKTFDTVLDRLAERIPAAIATRFHGDFHLGQVLLTGADFVIVDLEGEPGRPFEERRRKATPLTDVAGMLRSLDYARGHAVRQIVVTRQLEREAVSTLLTDWRDQAQQIFLEAYLTAMEGCEARPSDERDVRALLALATLEKVLYEIRYEFANRPDWVALPWRALRTLLDDAPE